MERERNKIRIRLMTPTSRKSVINVAAKHKVGVPLLLDFPGSLFGTIIVKGENPPNSSQTPLSPA